MATSPENEALQLLRSFLDALPDPALVVDRSRHLTALNRAAEEILSGPAALNRDLALSIRHPEVLGAVSSVLAGGPPQALTASFPLPVQREFEVHAASLPGGEITALLTLHDISAARATDRMRTDFVANVSHELRSPLSALLGFIETLQGAAADDAEARKKFLLTMEGEAKRMARLIDDLLSLSKVEAEEHVRPGGELELDKLLESVVSTLRPRGDEAGLRIELKVGDGNFTVKGDRDELEEVFHNLVDNGIKYGRGGEAVIVDLSHVDRIPDVGTPGIRASVRDHGEGIGSDHLPRLTERFYRIDKGRSRDLGGTGLGLAIVKHIVNRHRGRLVIESRAGEGSTFHVYLPQIPD
jgi:two-component system phosphate regulon sensor histidine kinase PhoR